MIFILLNGGFSDIQDGYVLISKYTETTNFKIFYPISSHLKIITYLKNSPTGPNSFLPIQKRMFLLHIIAPTDIKKNSFSPILIKIAVKWVKISTSLYLNCNDDWPYDGACHSRLPPFSYFISFVKRTSSKREQ